MKTRPTACIQPFNYFDGSHTVPFCTSIKRVHLFLLHFTMPMCVRSRTTRHTQHLHKSWSVLTDVNLKHLLFTLQPWEKPGVQLHAENERAAWEDIKGTKERTAVDCTVMISCSCQPCFTVHIHLPQWSCLVWWRETHACAVHTPLWVMTFSIYTFCLCLSSPPLHATLTQHCCFVHSNARHGNACVFVCWQMGIHVFFFYRSSVWEINCTSVPYSFYEPGFPTEHQSLMDLLCQSECDVVLLQFCFTLHSSLVWYSSSFISWSVTQQRPCLAITDCVVQRAVTQKSGRFTFTTVLSLPQRRDLWLALIPQYTLPLALQSLS